MEGDRNGDVQIEDMPLQPVTSYKCPPFPGLLLDTFENPPKPSIKLGIRERQLIKTSKGNKECNKLNFSGLTESAFPIFFSIPIVVFAWTINCWRI